MFYELDVSKAWNKDQCKTTFAYKCVAFPRMDENVNTKKIRKTDQKPCTNIGTYMWKVNTKEISQKLIKTLNQCVELITVMCQTKIKHKNTQADPREGYMNVQQKLENSQK